MVHMSNTRRHFLQSGAAVVAGMAGAVSASKALESVGERDSSRPQRADTVKQDSAVQVPKMKFFSAEISRMVLGVNPFYGFAHFNNNFGATMKEWYTPERVCEVMHRCNQYGINAFNYVHLDRAPQDLARFVAEGGTMHLIIQVTANADAGMLVKSLKPLALQRQGEVVDDAFQSGKMETVKEWCKKARDLGVLVGVGTHIPEVIEKVEEEGWDVDFYSGCVYNRRRTADEWKKILNGELLEMPHEIYVQSDPPRMYKVMRQTKKPCFAFKVLAAGRITGKGVEQAFRSAFDGIKPSDGIYVGMFPRYRDEVRENAEIIQRILAST
jgi:hypothetical protein